MTKQKGRGTPISRTSRPVADHEITAEMIAAGEAVLPRACAVSELEPPPCSVFEAAADVYIAMLLARAAAAVGDHTQVALDAAKDSG